MQFDRISTIDENQLRGAILETPNRPFVYLACPYASGDADYELRCRRFETVTVAAGKLMQMGYKVFSPITHSHPIAQRSNLPLHWGYWKDYDRSMLEHCCAVVVLALDGWMTSPGVQAEIELAHGMFLPVFLIRPEEVVR